MLSDVIELIESNRNFAITSHVRPDGDGIGSSLALKLVLQSMGKDAVVVMRDPIPRAYSRLTGAGQVVVLPRFDQRFDAVFIIECSDMDRPGLPGLAEQLTVNIDHHSTTGLFAYINWIDSTAAAVGEMIYNLCKALGVQISPEIAENIYAALLTDTGSFHFSNTTERTLKVASELVRLGARPAKISRSIYYDNPFSKIKLVGLALSQLQHDSTGRVAWLTVTREMMKEAGASEEDVDGIVSYPLSVGAVEAVAIFKEVKPGTYRTSLRSKDSINVAKLAEQFGGGGHRNASGCTLRGEKTEVERDVVNRLCAAMGLSPAVP
ncbi:MAG: bifunctional oligoribonuclease/PAP phosphatase NrnA [Acidobacteria bacterium]|nr:bifunctional oligoribonuclease/PAP phosphatase NrnA [Acidobacteriota bacterium]